MAKPMFDAQALIAQFETATAQQGEQVRKAVADATMQALQGRELTLKNIRATLKSVTDAAGGLRRYKITDPSLHNWFGLAMAMRDGDISDFPLCNKSFNLSYAGHDL